MMTNEQRHIIWHVYADIYGNIFFQIGKWKTIDGGYHGTATGKEQ